MQYLTETRTTLVYNMPLAEVRASLGWCAAGLQAGWVEGARTTLVMPPAEAGWWGQLHAVRVSCRPGIRGIACPLHPQHVLAAGRGAATQPPALAKPACLPPPTAFRL